MNESPTEHFEHAEHAEHVAESGNSFLLTVSMTIAVLAVAAATIGSLETIESGAAGSAKNEAVLQQSKASDQWAFYQAKSLKKNLFELAAAQSPVKADDYAREAKRYDDESSEIQKEAKELEHRSGEALEQADHHEHRHHVLTAGVTFLHVSIAVATISIITKGQRWPWYASLVLAAAGVLTAVRAYL
jgi:Domain of unknown function (DUF4337)